MARKAARPLPSLIQLLFVFPAILGRRLHDLRQRHTQMRLAVPTDADIVCSIQGDMPGELLSAIKTNCSTDALAYPLALKSLS